MLSIQRIDTYSEAIPIVSRLFLEYSEELNENLCFQGFDDELQDPLKKYGPPCGSLFLAFWDAEPAGCVALQPLQEQWVCEMKRLYVRPAFRKHGVGGELIKVLLREAKAKSYIKMVLDTLQKLEPAIKLYAKNGFQNTSAYYENPLNNVVYMEKSL